MSSMLKSLLKELSPCTSDEFLDYLKSSFILKRGDFIKEEYTLAKIRKELNFIAKKDPEVFKFKCIGEKNYRYGFSKFNSYLPDEPRYLKPKGYLKRCMHCSFPIYIEDKKIFHFKTKCEHYLPQENFKLLKFDSSYAIISKNYVHGVIDNFNSCLIRLPTGLPKNIVNSKNEEIISELWLINELARNKGHIQSDRLLPLIAEETLVE